MGIGFLLALAVTCGLCCYCCCCRRRRKDHNKPSQTTASITNQQRVAVGIPTTTTVTTQPSNNAISPASASTLSASDWFTSRSLPWTPDTQHALAVQGVLTANDLEFLEESVFMGLFSNEKPVTQAKAREAWALLHPERSTASQVPVVRASVLGQPYVPQNFVSQFASASAPPFEPEIPVVTAVADTYVQDIDKVSS